MNKSYEKVNYLLRLRKQIERKMIIETLQQLGPLLGGLSEYHYFGFGSVYFADFILFHKYLNISNMTSIDNEKEDKTRFLFNLPYSFITFKISDSSSYMAKELNWTDKLVIWLDYDNPLSNEIIDDIEYVAASSKPFDFFLTTLEAESPPDLKDFKDDFAKYLPNDLRKPDFKGKRFPRVLNQILKTCISRGLNMQTNGIRFLQLFNVTYTDTKKMYTFGGAFHETDAEEKLRERLVELPYISHGDDVFEIDCPLLTLKEKIHLDTCIEDWGRCDKVRAARTGLGDDDIQSYTLYYKYYPQFFESLY